MEKQLSEFIAAWQEDENHVKPLFVAVYDTLRSFPEAELSFKARPGISFSLRAKHRCQTGRDLFVLVDVIDDEPAARWLSVCFYADLVTDPRELGDVVPGGLGGENACCFDMESGEEASYLLEKLHEAYLRAGN